MNRRKTPTEIIVGALQAMRHETPDDTSAIDRVADEILIGADDLVWIVDWSTNEKYTKGDVRPYLNDGIQTFLAGAER